MVSSLNSIWDLEAGKFLAYIKLTSLNVVFNLRLMVLMSVAVRWMPISLSSIPYFIYQALTTQLIYVVTTVC